VKHVKFHLNRFLRRVRIHGGEFDTSARAMYRDEVVYPLQAELRIVRRSTIERKQMSTKTTFKRIALVTVAALGLSIVAVAPSSAATSATAVTFKAATTLAGTPATGAISSAIVTGDTATVYVSTSFINLAATDSVSVTGVRTAGASGTLKLSIAESSTNAIIGGGAFGTIGWSESSTAGLNVTAKWKADFVAPSTAGTYSVTFFARDNDGAAIASADPIVWTITVTAASIVADATSTLYISAGTSTPASADSATVSGSKSDTAQMASILLTQANANPLITPNEAVTVMITGSGLISNEGAANNASGAQVRALTIAKGDYVGVFADGTSGTGVITFTGNTSGTVYGSKTVTFYDTKPASMTATTLKSYVLASTTNVTNTFVINVKDALGNPITSLTTLTGAATDTTTAQVVGGAVTCVNTYMAATLLTPAGYYCGVKGLSATKFGKVNYTFTAADGAAVPNKVTATADVTFSAGVASKITLTGPATGTPGAVVSYTLTMTDANGYPVADQSYNNAASTGGAIFGAATVASGFSLVANSTYTDTITTVSGVATLKGTLPIAGVATATYTLSGTGIGAGTTTDAVALALEATKLTISTQVVNPGVDAATTASEEALAAASDAFDAALTAAEAAEMAQSIAQEALDSVASLRKRMNKRFNAIEKLIKRLL
jgi:trimeric autotransporter adhesin